MYKYRCEYCEGTVQPRTVKREAFKHKNGFVILEDVTIGVCDNCGNRYYSADILHAVHAVATVARLPERTEQIPVTHLESAWEHLSFVKSIFFIVVRASPLAYCTIRERGRSHCKCKTEMLPSA
ncbi:YgiT-type zinc finger protein [Microcoleus sp. D3_18a_C4]